MASACVISSGSCVCSSSPNTATTTTTVRNCTPPSFPLTIITPPYNEGYEYSERVSFFTHTYTHTRRFHTITNTLKPVVCYTFRPRVCARAWVEGFSCFTLNTHKINTCCLSLFFFSQTRAPYLYTINNSLSCTVFFQWHRQRKSIHQSKFSLIQLACF